MRHTHTHLHTHTLHTHTHGKHTLGLSSAFYNTALARCFSFCFVFPYVPFLLESNGGINGSSNPTHTHTHTHTHSIVFVVDVAVAVVVAVLFASEKKIGMMM